MTRARMTANRRAFMAVRLKEIGSDAGKPRGLLAIIRRTRLRRNERTGGKGVGTDGRLSERLPTPRSSPAPSQLSTPPHLAGPLGPAGPTGGSPTPLGTRSASGTIPGGGRARFPFRGPARLAAVDDAQDVPVRVLEPGDPHRPAEVHVALPR